MGELQTAVAIAADRAGAHSTAPALLLQAVTALGRLSEATTETTDAGRRPFRIPATWSAQLSELAYLVYLLADQTGVDIDDSVRAIADQLRAQADAADRQVSAPTPERDWF